MNFNHLNFLCKWLYIISICNDEKKMLFFFGIKTMIYSTHDVYNLMKIIKLPMKLTWIGLYILKHIQNFIQKININC